MPTTPEGLRYPTSTDPAAAGATAIQQLAEDVGAVYTPTALEPLNVKNYGAVGDGVTDDTVAVQAAVAALNQSSGGEIFFPSGTYKLTSTISLGSLRGIRLRGAGKPAQSSGTGRGNTVLLFSGTGYCLEWGVGAASTLFTGVAIENLHIVGSGTDPQGGVRLGNAANSLLRDVTVSDITRADLTGTGFRIDGAVGSQYNTLDNCTASAVDIGLDANDTNGLRVIGGLFEDNTSAPRAGTKGLWFRGGSEGFLFGVVVQGWDVLVDIDCPNVHATSCRMEGFLTAAYRVKQPQCSIIGGQINNFIAGAVGTGILIASVDVASTTIVMPAIGSVASTIVDNGVRTTILTDAGAILGNGLTTKPKDASGRSLEVRAANGQTGLLSVWADHNGNAISYIAADFSTRTYFTGLGGNRTLEIGAPDSGGAGYRTVRVAN